MASGGCFRVAVSIAALTLLAASAGADMNPHIPPAPDPALARSAPEAYEILIAPVVTVPVNIPQLLRNACRTQKDVWACTFFAAEKLNCKCVENDGSWKIAVSAEFVPVMYLRSERFRRHEMEHVEHVTGMLRPHLRELAARQFSSERACSVVAAREVAEFSELMNGFRRASNIALR